MHQHLVLKSVWYEYICIKGLKLSFALSTKISGPGLPKMEPEPRRQLRLHHAHQIYGHRRSSQEPSCRSRSSCSLCCARAKSIFTSYQYKLRSRGAERGWRYIIGTHSKPANVVLYYHLSCAFAIVSLVVRRGANECPLGYQLPLFSLKNYTNFSNWAPTLKN